MNKLNSGLAVSLVAGFAFFAFTEHDAQAALVCSSPLSTSDVTLSGNSADDCAGPGIGTAGGGNIQVADVNAAFGSLYGGGSFTYLYQNNGGLELKSPLDGVTFSITDLNLATTGSFDLNWTGGTIPPPKAFDLAIGLKGSTNSAIYLFDDFLLTSTPGSTEGTYKIAFKNASGKEIPALSNLRLFGRVGTIPPEPPVNEVPEPASLALLGVGLLGVGYATRRRRQAV